MHNTARPSLPPRRVPPPPPRKARSDDEQDPPSSGLSIAARLANLGLADNKPEKNNPSRLRPPPPPPPARKASGPTSKRTDVKDVTQDNVQEKAPELENPSHPWPDPGPPPPIPPPWTRPKTVSFQTQANDSKSTSSLPSPQPWLPTPPPEHMHPPEALDGQSREFECLKCRDFSHVDAHAALFPRSSVTSLQTLAYSLTSPFPSETEKARAIFTWLHENISYDSVSFFSGNIRGTTPEATLRSGLAVCEGYAGLFKKLADLAGLDSITISGHGKGFGYVPLGPHAPVPPFQGNHAWNAVLMDGEWHLIDACWGAGHLEGTTFVKRFSPSFFTSTPSEFGKRHFPTEPGNQLMANEDGGPVSWEDYILAPEGPRLLGDFYKLEYHPDFVLPSTRQIEGGQVVTFYVRKRCEHMPAAEHNTYVVFLDVGGEMIPLALDGEGGWSTQVDLPSGMGEISLFFVSQVNGADALGLGVRGFQQSLGRKAMAFGGLCQWTVT
jgi:transglutaminase-like putative cysteine protease